MTEEITTNSWISRLKDAFIGILVGLALIIGAVILIFWNEQSSLHTAQSLAQAKKELISIPSAPINKQNNLKVVYVSGMAATQNKLTDSILGITVTAINLDRSVEMYQWQQKVETRKESQVGGSEREVKTYSYTKVWSDKLIDSSDFHDQEGHKNPASMPVSSVKYYAKKVRVGDFVLPESMIQQISGKQTINLDKVNKESLKDRFNKPVSLNNDGLFLGQDSQNPNLGDVRIQLSAVYPRVVSIIAQQTGDTFQAYQAPAGESVLLITSSQESADQMIQDALSNNKMMTWALRLLSLILLITGFALIFKPLVILADVLPFLGAIIGFGTGFMAFILGFSLWVILTAIAWFSTRPIMSIGAVLIVVVIGYFLIKMRKQQIPKTSVTKKNS
jgi:hypothetical protein